jgi:hypothetical protein
MIAARPFASCMLALAGLVLTGCSTSGDARRAVALVEGTPIQPAQLNEWVDVELSTGHTHGRLQAQREALDLVIAWTWAEAEARALHVSVSSQVVNEQLDQLRYFAVRGGYEGEVRTGEDALRRFIVRPKISQTARLTVVRMWLTKLRLAARRVELRARRIPPSQVLSYYEHHRGRFLVGEHRDIRSIVNFSQAKTLEAKRELEAGVPFKTVAARFNEISEGGLLIDDPRGSQEKRLERDYFSAPPHVLIGPLREWAWYVFEVMRIRPAHPRPLSEVEASIRHTLAVQEDRATLAAREHGWRERTVCQAGYESSRCGRSEAA